MFCVEGSTITSLCRPQRLIMGKLGHDKARGGVGVAYFLLCRMHISCAGCILVVRNMMQFVISFSFQTIHMTDLEACV